MWLLLWNNKLVRYAAAGLLVGLLLYGVYLKVVHDAKEQGKQEAATQFSEQIEKQHAQDKAETDARLQTYDDQLKALSAQKQASDVNMSRIVATLATIASGRTTAAQTVQSATPDQLDALIASQLGHKDPKEPLTYSDKRVIAACLVDKPLCQQENEALKGQIAEDKTVLGNRDQTIQAWSGKYETLSSYTGRLEGYYATAYDLIPHKHRSVKCLYLWRCQDKKLPIPPPSH